MGFSLLQLDDNLIEGEPYNRLAWKNKRQLNVARQNSNISEMWETGFKNPPRRAASVWVPVQCRWHTDLFGPATHPWVKKCHSVTLNTKLRLQLTIQTALVQDIRLMTKKYVCTVKDLKTTSKSINQIRPVLMPLWSIQGGGVKKGVFFPKTSYKLGTDEKRGEQVGFSAPNLPHNTKIGKKSASSSRTNLSKIT